MSLESSLIRTWKDLCDAFMRQYQYNSDLAPSRVQLQGMTKGEKQSFKDYAQRWRDLASRVQPPLLDRELVDLFMSTLSPQYAKRMVGSVTTNFSNMVMVGERIESMIKSGMIPSDSVKEDKKRSNFILVRCPTDNYVQCLLLRTLIH